ncbi:hypothetical protein [Leucobacter sp.]
MTYLEIGLESPAVSLANDPNRVVSIDYEHVSLAGTLATRAAEAESATPAVKELADAVHSLVGVLTELCSGLHHGRINLHNYPVPGAHLER